MYVVLFMLIKINSLLASKIHEGRENKFITNELLMLQKINWGDLHLLYKSLGQHKNKL